MRSGRSSQTAVGSAATPGPSARWRSHPMAGRSTTVALGWDATGLGHPRGPREGPASIAGAGPLQCLALAPDGMTVAVGSEGGDIVIIDWTKGFEHADPRDRARRGLGVRGAPGRRRGPARADQPVPRLAGAVPRGQAGADRPDGRGRGGAGAAAPGRPAGDRQERPRPEVQGRPGPGRRRLLRVHAHPVHRALGDRSGRSTSTSSARAATSAASRASCRPPGWRSSTRSSSRTRRS